VSWLAAALALLLGHTDVRVELGPPERGLATTFCGKGDGRYCGGVAPYLGRRVRHDDWGVARRFKRRGSMVSVCNRRTGLCAVAPTIDAGPWVRQLPTGEGYNAAVEVRTRTLRPGKWRALIDLTVPVAAAIGSDGRDPVTVRSIRLRVVHRPTPPVVW